MTEPPRLFTYADLVRETSIPIGTLRVWYQRGHIPKADYRIGRSPAWLPETIRPWLEAHHGPP